MPSIEARRSANGKITSYRITVSDGTDHKGNPIRHRILWTPPKKGMTEKQMEKEALKFYSLFQAIHLAAY